MKLYHLFLNHPLLPYTIPYVTVCIIPMENPVVFHPFLGREIPPPEFLQGKSTWNGHGNLEEHRDYLSRSYTPINSSKDSTVDFIEPWFLLSWGEFER